MTTAGADPALPNPPRAAMPVPPLFRIVAPAAAPPGGAAAATAAAAMTAAAAAAAGSVGRVSGPRLGVLSLPGRRVLPTPNFFAVTSRGTLPHVTPDNAARCGLAGGAYLALEDFIETFALKKNHTPSIFSTPAQTTTTSSPHPAFAASPSRLHSFTALSPSTVTVLAPRRHPPAASHLGNGPDYISIATSTGFRKLTVDDYHTAIDTLQPDIAVAMADLTYDVNAADLAAASVPNPPAKRAQRMAERTEDWIDALFRGSGHGATAGRTRLFAPTLPVPYAMQWQYLNRLAELASHAGEAAPADADADADADAVVSGLAVYDVDLLPDLDADYAHTLASLPRLSLHPAPTPQHILRQVALGVDVLLLPGITAASEQGLAFVFAWPAKKGGEEEEGEDAATAAPPQQPLPLAIDLSDPVYKTSLAPLAPGCTCAACAQHHRAYVHHLLDAREMLAWTLLQIHNHHVVAAFLAGVRETLATATATATATAAAAAEAETEASESAFAALVRQFARTYESALPVGQAVRPRARGYQTKSEGADPPLNKPAWGRLEDVAAQQRG